PAAKTCEFEPVRQVFFEYFQGVHWPFWCAVADDMTIAMWEDHDIARGQVLARTLRQSRVGSPFSQQVTDDHVLCFWAQVRRDVGGPTANGPWSGKLPVEVERPLQLYSFQDLGYNVHCYSLAHGRF